MNESEFHKNFGINSNFTIDIKALFMEILDKMILIVLGGIVAVLATFLLCSTILHLNYESTTEIYIKPPSSEANSAYVSLEVGSLLTTDYSHMITSRDIIEDTISQFGLNTTYEKFVPKVKVNNPTDTRILQISVSDKDPYLARNLAIYIRDHAMADIQEKIGSEGISVIEQANLPSKTVVSNKVLSVLVGMFVMFLLTCLVVVRYLAIDRLVTADDIETRMKLPVLGTIAYEKGDSRR